MTSDAATVREALEFGRDCGSRSGEGKIMRDALAALDRLVAELRECRKAFGVGHSTLMRMQARAEAAEAERDRLLTATEPTRAGVQRRDGGAMMAFAGPSNHMCKCFGEGDGRDGSWRPCPPDLCEADVLVEAAAAREERLAELEAERDRLREALAECLNAAMKRRTSIYMDGTEMFANPLAAEVASIARAALGETP